MEQGWSGSTLEGPKTNGWLEGEARCVLPNGVIYQGQFQGGNFHGEGVLIYPEQGRYTAKWEEGRAVSGHFSFNDGLPYQVSDWSYLVANDRRLVEETRQGFGSQCTAQPTGHELPEGTYDTGYGFFDRQTGEIKSYDGHSVVAAPNALLANWTVSRCKRGNAQHDKSSN